MGLLRNFNHLRLHTTACTDDPNEYMTDLNACSICNEANTTDGWSVWSGDAVLSTSSDNVQGGNYKIVATTPSGTSTSVVYTIPGSLDTDEYDVNFWARTNGGCDATMSLWINCTGGPSGVDVTTSWVEYTYSITATADTVRLRFYPDGGGEGGCGAPGDTIEIDNLSIIKTN